MTARRRPSPRRVRVCRSRRPLAPDASSPRSRSPSRVVRLGDLFADAGDRAGDAVAPAPPPGMRITYGADWLAAVAREHRLAWTPSSAYDQVTIERASRDIDSDAIRAADDERDRRAPARRGRRARARQSRPCTSSSPPSAPDAIAVDGLTIDQRSGRVSAIVSAPAGDPAARAPARHRPARLSRRGAGAQPRRWRPARRSPPATSTTSRLRARPRRRGHRDRRAAAHRQDAAPRRCAPGEPVRLGDVELPILVHKGELVTIVLETADLQLTAQGQGARRRRARARRSASPTPNRTA